MKFGKDLKNYLGETTSKKILHKSKGSWVAITVTSVLFGVSAFNAPQVFANENSVSGASSVQEVVATSVSSEISSASTEENTYETLDSTESKVETVESTVATSESVSVTAETAVPTSQSVVETAEDVSTTSEEKATSTTVAESEIVGTETEDASSQSEITSSEDSTSEVTSETTPVVEETASSTSDPTVDSTESKVAAQSLMSAAATTSSTVGETTSVVEETTTVDPVRYDGSNREAVAVNVAKAHFSDSKKVILVNRDKFPDAISATNISQGLYPVLYTRAGKVDQATINQIKAMPLNEIYILGGVNSVEDKVVSQLTQSTGVKVTRISGRDRYVVNTNAIKTQYTTKDHVVIASGEIYTDALYGVSYANTIDSPVVLSKKNGLTTTSIELLKTLGAKKATLIGGVSTLTQSVESQLISMGIKFDRIAGANRYNGSAQVASASYKAPENVVIASGEVFSDALVSAPLAQKLNAPILLVRKDRVDSSVSEYVSDKKATIKNIYIQGGTNTIAESNKNTIGQATTHVSKVTETKNVTVKANTVQFQTETQANVDTTIPANKSVVIQKGENGYDEVTYSVTYVNGVETGRVEIGRTTILPVTQIVKTGTKEYESGIRVSSSDRDSIIVNGSTLQLTANLISSGTAAKNVTWSVISTTGTGSATITNDGLLTATAVGKVTVIAKSKDNSNISGAKEINIAIPVKIRDYSGTKTDLIIPEVISNSQLDANGNYNGFVVVAEDADKYWWRSQKFAEGEVGIVTVIGDSAFKNKQLTSVVLPNSIVEIENNAFLLNNIQKVTIPDSVETIGASAFKGNLIAELLLGNNVTLIDSEAFSNNKLAKVTILGKNLTIGEAAFRDNRLSEVTFNQGVKVIGNYAFAGNGSSSSEGNQITSVTMPASMKSVGDSAFAYNNMTSLVLNDGLTDIDRYAFYRNKLEKVTIPNTVSKIGEYAFYINEIYTLNLSKGLIRIERGVFSSNNIKNVILPTTLQYIGSEAFHDNEITELVIPNNVTIIERYAFNGNKISKIALSNTLTTIGEAAFAFNALTGVVIPTSVQTIESEAFMYNNIESIIIPGKVKSVGFEAFAYNNLTSVTIAEGVSSIGGNAFVNRSYPSIEPNNITIGNNVQLGNYLLNDTNNNFQTAYNTNGAGNYTRRSDGTWEKITG